MSVEDDEDLSKLDRGDEVTEVHIRARDRKTGKFAPTKNEEVAEVEDEEKDKVELDKVEVDKVEIEDPKAKEEDAEELDDEEDDDEEEGKKENFPVRLNKAKRQRDKYRDELAEAQRRLAALEAEVRVRSETKPEPKADPIKVLNEELDTLYTQVEEARAEGKSTEAAKLQRQIDQKNGEILKIESAKIAARTSSQAQLDAQYDAMVDVLEATYGVLNRESEDFDPATVRDLEELSSAFEARGMTGPAALRKAAKMIFREDPFVPGGLKKAPEAKEPEKPEPKKPEKKPEPKKPDVKARLETDKKQPPDVADRGVNRGDDVRINAGEISDEDFEKLPLSKKKELRGDFV